MCTRGFVRIKNAYSRYLFILKRTFIRIKYVVYLNRLFFQINSQRKYFNIKSQFWPDDLENYL